MVVPFILTPVTVPVFDVFPFQLVISEAVIPAAALALNTGSVSVVRVPVFFVNPHPATVDSVGIMSLDHAAAPLTTLNTFPLSEALVLGRGVVTLTPLEFTVKPLFEGTLTE